MLGDTTAKERRRALDDFEGGRADTLVQVGVLLEGWSSPRCKLLIDHRPDVVARSRHPEVLPRDDARRRQKVVLTGRLDAPKLDGSRPGDVRAVLDSSERFDPDAPCELSEFRAMRFDHPLFSGQGRFLLRWLCVPSTVAEYAAFLARVYPDGAAGRLLLEGTDIEVSGSCYEDARHLVASLPANGRGRDPGFAEGWRALTGHSGLTPEVSPDPLATLLRAEEADEVAWLVSTLKPRWRRMVAENYGLFDQTERLRVELAELEDVGRERVTQVMQSSAKRHRHAGDTNRGELRTHDLADIPPWLKSWGARRSGLRAAALETYQRECVTEWTAVPGRAAVRAVTTRCPRLDRDRRL